MALLPAVCLGFLSASCGGNAPQQTATATTTLIQTLTPTMVASRSPTPKPPRTPTPCIAPIASPTATAVPSGRNAWAVYDPEPEHLWNRLFRALFQRVTTNGQEYGGDVLDPLLWRDTDHLLSGPSHADALQVLDEFLATPADLQIRDPIRRAMFQRDLWSVFDWLTVRSDTYPEQREALKARLASAIHAVALSGDEIKLLPDNYQAAISAGRFPAGHSGCYLSPPFLPPGLVDASDGWTSLGSGDGPIAISHLQDTHFLGRSAFLVFVRVPGDREATLRFVEQMAARTAHDVPAGTEVALVRKMLLVDDRGDIVATPIVEDVEIRRFVFSLPGSQDFYKFVVERSALFAGAAGGLRLSEKEFPLFRSHEIDEFELKGGPAVIVPASCKACHANPSLGNSAAQSILSYSRALFAVPGSQATGVKVTTPEAETRTTIEWKTEQPSWNELRSLWQVRDVETTAIPQSASECPVTKSADPNEANLGGRYGNTGLWTSLWPGGTIVFRPGGPGFIDRDGSLGMKWPWTRGDGIVGRLTIEGRRLDAVAPPLRASIPEGYFGDTGFQSTALIFPTEGCWEITGRAGVASLTFVTLVVKIGEGPSWRP